MEIKPIDYYPGYFAREDGEILNANNKVLGKSLTSGGYHTVFINNKNVHVHELVLSAFEPLADRKNMVANHFDLNKINNAYSNLDWVDAEWNNIHLNLMLKKNPNRPHIKTLSDNKLLFNTIDDCAEHFNKTTREVWLALKKGRDVVDGVRLAYLKWDDLDVLRAVKYDTLKRDERGPREVKLLDLLTGEIKLYPSMLSAANDIGTVLQSIRGKISTAKSPKILFKRYIVADKDGNFDYLTDELKAELLGRGGKPVITYHIPTKKFQKYKSAYAFMKECELRNHRKAITVNLQKNKIKETNGYFYAYVTLEHEDNPERYLKAIAGI